MRRRALGPAVLFALASACSSAAETPRVAIATDLVVPKGVLTKSTRLSLTVLEGDVACDAASGAVTFPNGAAAAKELAKSELAPNPDCAGGARFCGTLSVDKSDATRVFSAVAKGVGDATLAVGCASAKVDQDALPLTIKMFRFLEPASCGDGTVQPTEQCEPAGGICDETCATKEILVSTGSAGNGTQDGGVGDKSAPFLLWPSGSGTSGRFFAFFTDKQSSGSNLDVALRAMGDDLSPLTSPPALASGSIFLPNGPTFPPTRAIRQQSMPAAAFLNGKYYVVFQDDDTPGSNGLDIHLRSMDGALVAEQGATPVGINGPSGAGEANAQREPYIAAGPKGRLFIAWEDAGRIVGRTLTPPSTLGTQNALSSDTVSKGVSVAATSTGWVALWQSSTGIKLRIVNEDGTPQGQEQTVNEAGSITERPRVASLPDGRFAVTWASGGDVYVQRFDAKGSKIAGDQATPVNDTSKPGERTTPSIAGTAGVDGSYVVAWLDAPTGEVHARMLGGTSGFLFNHVNGQSTEFVASRVDGRSRANPVVVAGGSGPFVAIGWEDKTSPGAGIVVRRFPLPEE